MICPKELSKYTPIKGVVHIGSNDGVEVPYYLEMGISNIICFDPLPQAGHYFLKQYGHDHRILFTPAAFGETNCYRFLTVTSSHGQQSTFLPVINREIAYGEYFPEYPLLAYVTRFDTYMSLIPEAVSKRIQACNCLVIDVQGMEYQVLLGMAGNIQQFDCAGIECSGVPIYQGEAPSAKVEELMSSYGFKALNEARQHGDVLFVRRELCQNQLS